MLRPAIDWSAKPWRWLHKWLQLTPWIAATDSYIQNNFPQTINCVFVRRLLMCVCVCVRCFFPLQVHIVDKIQFHDKIRMSRLSWTVIHWDLIRYKFVKVRSQPNLLYKMATELTDFWAFWPGRSTSCGHAPCIFCWFLVPPPSNTHTHTHTHTQTHSF